MKGLRKDKSIDALLHTRLLHPARGRSLREIVVRARKANLADLSDVVLLKRPWWKTRQHIPILVHPR